MSGFFPFCPGNLTHDQASWYLSISSRRLEELVLQGKIIPRAEGAKRVYPREELDAYRASLPEYTRRPRTYGGVE